MAHINGISMKNLGVTIKNNKVYYNASIYVSNRYLGEWEQGIDGESDYFSFKKMF